MKKLLWLLVMLLALCGLPLGWAQAADAPSAADQAAAPSGADRATQAAAAATAARRGDLRTPDFLEHLVDSVLGIFDVRSSGNTVTHYAISALLLVFALLARRIVTGLIFKVLRKLAARTTTTLDDKLFPALEGPAAAFVMVVGIFAALKVLKLSVEADTYIAAGSQIAFSLTIFWGLWRTLGALLDHGSEIARNRSLGVAAFMPWIRKSLMSVFIVFAVLLTIQSMGYDVKTILAGLGIGGLAFALAAQDTLANIFGAIVVAIDQPFKLGETVKIGQNVGGVEDIGLRSTRIRLVDKSLMVLPNKTVAAEAITNFSRFTKRRVEQVLSLTYATKPAEMEEIVKEIRGLIEGEAEVDRGSVHVYFRDLSASSLDIWLVYETKDADFVKSMQLRQRLNLAFMRTVEKRGLAFAFPTKTVHLVQDQEASVARKP